MESPAVAVPYARREGRRYNRAGVAIATSEWDVPSGEPAAAIIFVPGYNHYQSLFYDWLANRLLPAQIACFGMDSESFGRSVQGGGLSCSCRGRLRAYIPDFASLVQDYIDYAADVKSKLPPGTPVFLHGESMGGGIAILASKAAPHLFSGVILTAPMAKLNTKSHPPAWLQAVGAIVAAVVPWAPIAPVTDITPVCFKDVVKRDEVQAGTDKLRYMGRMRLATALQLRDAATTVQQALPHLQVPMLVQQGTNDMVTPEAGIVAYDAAVRCTDKTLVVYEGAWHAMYAEPVDTRKRLVMDMISWMRERAPSLREVALPKEYSEALPPMPVGTHRYSRPEGKGPFRDATVWSASHHAILLAVKAALKSF